MNRSKRGAAAAWTLPGALLLPVWSQAHSDSAPAGSTSFETTTLVLLLCVVGLLTYGAGVYRLWGRAGLGRGTRSWRVGGFTVGMVALFLALVWPLDGLSAGSFAAHMGQHVILMVLAAPLLVLGRPVGPFLWALPPAWRHGLHTAWRASGWHVWRVLTQPTTATLLHAAAIWAWHAPAAFDAALESEVLHALEHTSFLVTALLFWEAVLHRAGRAPLGYGAGAFWVFITLMQGGMLGAMLTFAPEPLYQAQGPPAFGLSALEDQQLAGLIMWVPAGMVYLGAGILLVGLWLEQSAREPARVGARMTEPSCARSPLETARTSMHLE